MHWNVQMPELVTAYLWYHSHGLGDGSPPQQLSDEVPLPVPRLRLSNVQLIDMFSESGCHCPSSTLTCCSSTAAHTQSNARPSIPKWSSHIPWLPGYVHLYTPVLPSQFVPLLFSSSTSHLPLVQHSVLLPDFVPYAPGISIRHSLHSY